VRELWLAIPGEPTTWRTVQLTSMLGSVLAFGGGATPAGSKCTSHSLRTGTRMEKDLLWIQLPARLARFGWQANIERMSSLYFYCTMKLSAASYLIFAETPAYARTHRTPSAIAVPHTPAPVADFSAAG
jgi:hypothetical protein